MKARLRSIVWICAWVALMPMGMVDTASALELHRERTSPFDLALTGRLAGVAAGETRYVRWAELRAMPTALLRLTDEFVPGDQEVTVVFLAELWKQLPRGNGTDALLTTCGDGYAAVFKEEFIARYRPFLVLEINGRGPEQWPPEGLKFNPGPYVISVSKEVEPAVARFLDAEHKKPWGVTTLELANFSERFRAIYSGAWMAPVPRVAEGREIWINSCACCHQGPAQIFGGTKSEQPFAVVQAIACWNPEFFRKYVRDPKSLIPLATMEPHPHYTDAQLAALIAFIAAGSAPGSVEK